MSEFLDELARRIKDSNLDGGLSENKKKYVFAISFDELYQFMKAEYGMRVSDDSDGYCKSVTSMIFKGLKKYEVKNA